MSGETRQEKIVRARELRAEGETYREIGEKLGVSLSAAYLWLNPEYAKHRARRSITDEARARAARFIAMRKEGLLNMVLSRARRYGLEVPASPYRRGTELEPPEEGQQ